MSDAETFALMARTAERLFSTADDRKWRALWDACRDAGVTAALADEANGGMGLTPGDLTDVIVAGGAAAAPGPWIESTLAGWLWPGDLPSNVVTLAEPSDAGLAGGRLDAICPGTAWGAASDHVLLGVGDELVLVSARAAETVAGANLADEPRDQLTFKAAAVLTAKLPGAGSRISCALAAARAAQMAGALRAALGLSVDYVGTREQFGRPLGRLQAVQQMCADLAATAAAAEAAARIGLEALGGPDEMVGVAIAKTRVGEAAAHGAALAHQVHGAMGFTRDYPLQRFTRRLWSWRDEAGSEHIWARRLGERLVSAGADGVWPLLTTL